MSFFDWPDAVTFKKPWTLLRNNDTRMGKTVERWAEHRSHDHVSSKKNKNEIQKKVKKNFPFSFFFKCTSRSSFICGPSCEQHHDVDTASSFLSKFSCLFSVPPSKFYVPFAKNKCPSEKVSKWCTWLPFLRSLDLSLRLLSSIYNRSKPERIPPHFFPFRPSDGRHPIPLRPPSPLWNID